MGRILYLPVREVICPPTIDALMMPSTSGSISRPEAVGDAPFTSCQYSGRVRMPPNIPIPRMKDRIEPVRNEPTLNRRNGMSATGPSRDSTTQKAARPRTPTT